MPAAKQDRVVMPRKGVVVVVIKSRFKTRKLKANALLNAIKLICYANQFSTQKDAKTSGVAVNDKTHKLQPSVKQQRSLERSRSAQHERDQHSKVRPEIGEGCNQGFLKKTTTASLHALTTAALVLPGLFSPTGYAADDDEFDFQYSHYQEGKRNISVIGADPNNGTLVTGSKSFNPIEVEGLHGRAKFSLTDRVKFAFNYIQDTWGGATPLATVPFLATGNSSYSINNVVAGATPYASSGAGLNNLYLDSKSNKLFQTDQFDPITQLPIYKNDNRLTHIMATASPETRKQGDFKLSYDFDNATLSAGGGLSIERDYDSRFGNLGGRFDFNQKRTTLNVDLSYTNNYTHATLDHDDYTTQELVPENQLTQLANGKKIIHGIRQDWAAHLGLTQVLSKNSVVSADFGFNRSTGYLGNPYKAVAIAFVDTNPDPLQYGELPTGIFPSEIKLFTEKRPDVRNQFNVGGNYAHFIEGLDAALHFKYQFSADDWGIQAHTFDADWAQPIGNGFTVTPHIRYYSQDAANFYTPYVITQQAYNKPVNDVNGNPVFVGSDGKDYTISFDPETFLPIYVDAQGNPVSPSVTVSDTQKTIPYDPKKLPANYSSDQRLSGFGTLSGGVSITKQFTKGFTLESGFEYYTHQGGLKLGGGGEGSYANFDYWVANATLKVNLDALALRGGGGGSPSHADHSHQHGSAEPAGVMFAHMLPKAGDFMTGYRFMWSGQSGNMQHGTTAVSDSVLGVAGCGGDTCFLTPSNMTMSMHMLDLMYAPTDWMTLMLMPQFVDMSMDMRALNGVTADQPNSIVDGLAGHFTHHTHAPHETGGIGDLGMYALFKVLDDGVHHIHATAGLSAPTGDVNIKFRRAHTIEGGFQSYGMQLGSGTWDFKPSLTYTGHLDDWSWGAQASGTVRMQDHNQSGYRLGDIFQGTAWGSYGLTNWLSASVRGVYTVQGSISRQFNGSAGGQFVDHTITKTKVESQQQFDADGNPLFDENGFPVNKDVLVTEVTPVNSSILKFGPQDYPQNYGGRFWDVGFGLSAIVPSGPLAGNRVSVEWLQPVHTDYNGYQLERSGALSATWSKSF